MIARHGESARQVVGEQQRLVAVRDRVRSQVAVEQARATLAKTRERLAMDRLDSHLAARRWLKASDPIVSPLSRTFLNRFVVEPACAELGLELPSWRWCVEASTDELSAAARALGAVPPEFAPTSSGETWGLAFGGDEFWLLATAPASALPFVALHELRHLWQHETRSHERDEEDADDFARRFLPELRLGEEFAWCR